MAVCPVCGGPGMEVWEREGRAWFSCCQGCDEMEILAVLGLTPVELCVPISDKPVRLPSLRSRADGSRAALLAIEPREYVEVLAGVELSDAGYICCPLHDERTPSFRAYPDPERGWYCHGCHRGGDIYSLAAALWSMDPRRDFPALHKRLVLHFRVAA